MSTFLTARWMHLAMINFEIDPDVLAPRVPLGTELDDWQGRCFVSLVGFQFLDTRVLGIPIPFHRDFEEVNLRFYVRRQHPDGLRRGVVFVKELVPRRAIANLARLLYNENYQALPMSHRDRLEESGQIEYAWQLGGRANRMAVDVAGPAYLADESSEESFITEHYWGYVRQRDGVTVEYRVEHPRWQVWRAAGSTIEIEVDALYGSEFVAPLAARPVSAFVADGSPVRVHHGVRLA